MPYLFLFKIYEQDLRLWKVSQTSRLRCLGKKKSGTHGKVMSQEMCLWNMKVDLFWVKY